MGPIFPFSSTVSPATFHNSSAGRETNVSFPLPSAVTQSEEAVSAISHRIVEAGETESLAAIVGGKQKQNESRVCGETEVRVECLRGNTRSYNSSRTNNHESRRGPRQPSPGST